MFDLKKYQYAIKARKKKEKKIMPCVICGRKND